MKQALFYKGEVTQELFNKGEVTQVLSHTLLENVYTYTIFLKKECSDLIKSLNIFHTF